MKNLAIIPARSGSKGLKDKNIKELCGKPLLYYSIEAALNSKLFDEVMVSTDSEEYARLALKGGASVPFLRSREMAQDKTTTWDTVAEVLNSYKQAGQEFDTVCILQPTSPLRTHSDIIEAYNILKNKNAKYVVSVCKAEHSPLWCNQLPEDDSLKGFIDNNTFNRGGRQNLGEFYRLNGAIYICSVDAVDDFHFRLYEDGCYAYRMNRRNSIDIDDIEDFKLAELYMNGR